MKIKNQVDAKKETRDRAGAIDILKGAKRVVTCRGKKVVEFDRKTSAVEEELLKAALGPTGNLRAPTVVRGKTVIVGFHPDAYEAMFGES